MATKLLLPLTIGAKYEGSFVTRKVSLVTETLPTFVAREWLLLSVCCVLVWVNMLPLLWNFFSQNMQ